MANTLPSVSFCKRFFHIPPTVRTQALAFLLAAMILTCRCLIFRDIRDPWAEDATDIIPGALSTAWNPLLPVADVVMILGRLFGLVATSISLAYTPVLLSIFSILFYSFITSYFCRPGFSWLVPSERVRFWASLSFAMAPGTAEVIGNAVCVMYTITVWAVLLLLERPHAKGIIPKWIFILLSTPLTFVCIPLLALLYWVRRERIYLSLLALSGMGLLLSAVVRGITPHAPGPAEFSFDWRLLKVFQVLWGGMLAPLLSALGAMEVAEFSGVFRLLLLILCLTFGAILRRVPRDVAMAIVGLLAIVPIYHGVHALTRPYGYTNLDWWSALAPSSRISFITIFFPMMVWFVLLSHAGDLLSRTIRMAMLACIVLISFVTCLVVARDLHMERLSAWPQFQSWLRHARTADGVRGSTAELPVMLPFLVEWARLSCVRKEFSIECRVGQGNTYGNHMYTLPVESHE